MAAPPIVLGNAPSTGSTLLRALLSRHPSIAAGGELGILDKPGLYRESPESFQKHILGWLRKGYPAPFLGSGNTLFRHWRVRQLRKYRLWPKCPTRLA